MQQEAMATNTISDDMEWNDLAKILKSGDLIEISRSSWQADGARVPQHWAIYVGILKQVHQVIHYSSEDLSRKVQKSAEQLEKAEVTLDLLKTVACGCLCRKNNAWDAVETPLIPAEILKIAKRKVGQKGYNSVTNNSEHLAYFCRYGKHKSAEESPVSNDATGSGSSTVDCGISPSGSWVTEVAREKLRAAVCCAIHELPQAPSLEAVRAHLLPDGQQLSPAAEAIFRATHSFQLRIAIFAHSKEAIASGLDTGNADSQVSPDDVIKTSRLMDALQSPEERDSILQELEAFRRRIARGAHAGDGLTFAEALSDWLLSGEPSAAMWSAVKNWHDRGGGLAAFRQLVKPLVEHTAAHHGSIRKVLEAANKLEDAGELADRDQILQLLGRCCSTELRLEDGHLRVEGAIVVMSLVSAAIRAHLSAAESPPHTVSIYAADCLSLDEPIDWRGANLCVVTRRLYAHEDVTIDLSGRSFSGWPGEQCPRRPGVAGLSGRAGQSSGNLCLLAAELVGAERLCVQLNGGRGEDGQGGAAGAKGAPGKTVSRTEIIAMDFPGVKRSEEESKTKTYQVYPKEFLLPERKHYEFVDTQGKHITYSANFGSSPRSLTIAHGTLGEDGLQGGVGGAGGEGGYPGTCHITDFDGNRHKLGGGVHKGRGEPGTNGPHGARGPPGDCGSDFYCWKGGAAVPTVGMSGAGKKLRVSYSTVYFKPDGGFLLPHTMSRVWKQTYAHFEECEPERRPVKDPERTHPDRVQAVAQATLQASTAMSEFAAVNGNRLNNSSRTAAAAAGVGQARTREGAERVQMVLEREPGAEEIDEDDFDVVAPDPVNRPSLLSSERGLWNRGKLRVIARGGNSFDVKFSDAQHEFLRDNAALIVQVNVLIDDQPPSDICLQQFTSALGQDHRLQIELAQSALKSSDHESFIRLIRALIVHDGDKATAAKWRAIVDVIYSLVEQSCEWTLLAVTMACTSPDAMLNTLLHLRLIFATRKFELLLTSELLDPRYTLKSTEARALLMIKLENDFAVEEIKQVLVLLRHSDRQLHHLSRLTYREWVEIARRQNWMLVDQEEFGTTAYYLGVLTRAGMVDEEARMRAVLREWKHTEHLFGRFVHCIVSREIDANETFCSRLRQAVVHEELKNVLGLLPYAERSTDSVALLVRGLNDADDEARARRQARIQAIVAEFSAQPPVSEHAKYLAEFDDALFATVRKRLRAVQKVVIMSALESKQHLLQQVATGEGKSYIIAAIAAIRCKLDEKATVDVISSSSVLAQRDATQLKDLFRALKLTVAHVCHESRESREIAYKARIVYGDMAHFQRDYLLHTFYRKNIRGSRQLTNVIVDEVDSMTLDGGNHVLYLAHSVPSLKLLDSLFAFIQREVHSAVDEEQDTYIIRIRVLRDILGRVKKEELQMIDQAHGDSIFTALVTRGFIDEEGFLIARNISMLSHVESTLRSVADPILLPVIIDAMRMEMERPTTISLPFHLRDFVRLHITTFINNCKRARVMRPNVDYVIDTTNSSEASVTIIDCDTGADLASTQWAGGLHQFLQMKHACRISSMTLKAVFISNVTFLTKYTRLDGLSGTLGSTEESRTLAALYGVDLIRVPTHQPRRMVELVPSLSHTHSEWIGAVYDGISREVETLRSVLIVCETIEQLQHLQSGLASLNTAAREQSTLMDAAMDTLTTYTRQHERLECEETGLEAGRVVLSTNLAGRGTDILLSDELEAKGGLHVIVAFVPRNKRIEEQAMGRAARCGARGSGQIIAMVRATPGELAPTYLDFQSRRDNAEIVRIQALRHHFEYRIAVEEGALERFRHAIDDKLFREDASAERLPEAEDVIYRALLDEWTLWLDSQDDEIKRCADARDPLAKQRIVESVDDFLASHKVEKRRETRYSLLTKAQMWLVKARENERFREIVRNIEDGASSIPLVSRVIGAIQQGLSMLRSDQAANSGGGLQSTIDELTSLLVSLETPTATDEKLVVPAWIHAGEWLLRLGIIQACHANGRRDAERTFQRVIDDCEALAPCAFYYLACMKMTAFEAMREGQASLLITSDDQQGSDQQGSASDDQRFEEDVDQAIGLFAQSRAGFVAQLERRSAEVRAVQQRAQTGSGPECGLQRQLREHETATKQIIANIDWLIGVPMSAASFRPLVADERKQKQLFAALKSIDVIAPPTIASQPRDIASCRRTERKFGMGRGHLQRALANLQKKDNTTTTSTKPIALNGGGAALAKHCSLPTRLDFWQHMHAISAFVEVQHVYIIDRERLEAVQESIGIAPSSIDEERARGGILYSNASLQDLSYFPKSQIDEMIAAEEGTVLSDKVRDLLDDGSLELGMLAQVDVDRLRETHLLYFDGFSPAQLKQHFGFNDATREWILNMLSSHRVIEMKVMPCVRLVGDWKERAVNFKWSSPTTPRFRVDNKTLEALEKLESVFTITAELLQHTVQALRRAANSAELAQELFDALLDAGLLQRQQSTIYRQGSRPAHIDCSMLPALLAEPMMRFLSHHFAYTFARDALLSACEDSMHEPFTIKAVMLPVDAHQELFEELCKAEIVSAPRIVGDHYELIDYDDFPFVPKRDFERFVHSRRQKLRDAIQMFALVPFAQVLAETGAEQTDEMEALVDLGLAAGVSLKKLTLAKKIAGKLFGIASFVVSKGLMLIKGISCAVGTAVGFLAHGAASLLGYAADGLGKIMPTKWKKGLYSAVSGALDAYEWMQKQIGRLLSWTLRKIASLTSYADFSSYFEIAQRVGGWISKGMSYMYQQCQALFGSAEYYEQCRIATHKIAAEATVGDAMDEYRLIRLFNGIGAVTEDQDRRVSEREQALIDQTKEVARMLKEEVLSHLTPPATISFRGLAKRIKSLENNRWFESELDLAIQWLAMESRRALINTGRVDDVQCPRMTHVTVAYAALLRTVEEEAGQPRDEETDDSDEEEASSSLDLITDCIDIRMSDLFTSPITTFIRCIFSEHFASEASRPLQSLCDADIAKAARKLSKGKSTAWLDSLHHSSLVAKVHERIGKLCQMLKTDRPARGNQAVSIILLCRSCTQHGLPVPFEPWHTILCSYFLLTVSIVSLANAQVVVVDLDCE